MSMRLVAHGLQTADQFKQIKAVTQANKKVRRVIRNERKANTKAVRKTLAPYKMSGVTFQHRKGARFGVVHGLGDYTWNAEGGVAKHIAGTSVDSTIGRLARSLGGSLGGEGWSNVGGHVGNWFSKILGFGDYNVQSNSVVSSLTGDSVPVMHSENDSVVIRHREFIGDIVSSTAFANTAYAINPGNIRLFPWLAPIAANFKMWKMRGCLFEYKSTSANAFAAANPGMGVVMMTTNYNVYDPAFTNKMMVDNNNFTTSGRPMDTFVHPLECAQSLSPYKWMYVRNTPVPNGQDARLYDMGLFQVATVGTQTVATIGELWITYEIELAKPILYGGIGVDTPGYMSHVDNTVVGVTTETLVAPDRNVGNITLEYNSIGMVFDPLATKIIFPPGALGVYVININVVSNGNVTINSGWGATVNLTNPKLFADNLNEHSRSYVQTDSAVSKTLNLQWCCYLTDPTQAASIVAPIVQMLAGDYTVTTVITQLPYNLGQIAAGLPILTSKPMTTRIENRTSEFTSSINPYSSMEISSHEEMKEDPYENACEMQEIVNCPRPQQSMMTSGLRALGLSKSTLDIPALKRQ